MAAIKVNVDNFVRAESDRMFAAVSQQAGGLGEWLHYRSPTPLDQQTVIRMNRDTLYSMVVVDASLGLTLTLPDAAERYLSAMVIDQDHYVPVVLHDPGRHELGTELFATRHVLIGVRMLVDPGNAEDVATVNALQDQLLVTARSTVPFQPPSYEEASLTATRRALLKLAEGLYEMDRTFGARDEVDPVRHLIGTAAGWAGLPEREAIYINVNPDLPVGEYRISVRDVPVDGFWSLSLYNADGYFDQDSSAVSVNNLTATPNADGSVTIHFGGCGDGRPNCLPIMEGWNYTVRLYRPRPEVLDGSWKFPDIESAP